jgi:hypothetical protein
MGNRLRTASIHILDNDSLLHVFYLYWPFVSDDDFASLAHWISDGRWWYTLAHVCRRWRNIILGSATYLGLSLLCTYGAPVADMLEHSPPLPLVVGYFMDRELTTEDEEGIILALKHHDRIRRIRLSNHVTIIQKLIMAMDEEYPILEYLYITLSMKDNSSILQFSETFQAPHLRYLNLRSFALPIGSRLLTIAADLVTLYLIMVDPSTYFPPNTLIQWISLMPQLEILSIYFKFSTPGRDVVRQLVRTPIIAPITLPNLRRFDFHGVSTYTEALVHRITTPHLKKLKIQFFNQLTFSVPRLLQFIDAAENLRFDRAGFTFSEKRVDTVLYANGETKVYALGVVVNCCHLDWQVSSMAQISHSLSQIFSEVDYLALQHKAQIGTSEEHNEADLTEWRKLLRPFSNVKTLRIQKGLVKDLSRCLELEDGELPFKLLPELQELRYSGSSRTDGAFTSFVDARRNAGRPVTLVRL